MSSSHDEFHARPSVPVQTSRLRKKRAYQLPTSIIPPATSCTTRRSPQSTNPPTQWGPRRWPRPRSGRAMPADDQQRRLARRGVNWNSLAAAMHGRTAPRVSSVSAPGLAVNGVEAADARRLVPGKPCEDRMIGHLSIRHGWAKLRRSSPAASPPAGRRPAATGGIRPAGRESSPSRRASAGRRLARRGRPRAPWPRRRSARPDSR